MLESPAILFAKPGAISEKDRRVLRSAGVIVVDVADPADVKFVRAHTELPGGDLLAAAAKAIDQMRELFASGFWKDCRQPHHRPHRGPLTWTAPSIP